MDDWNIDIYLPQGAGPLRPLPTARAVRVGAAVELFATLMCQLARNNLRRDVSGALEELEPAVRRLQENLAHGVMIAMFVEVAPHAPCGTQMQVRAALIRGSGLTPDRVMDSPFDSLSPFPKPRGVGTVIETHYFWIRPRLVSQEAFMMWATGDVDDKCNPDGTVRDGVFVPAPGVFLCMEARWLQGYMAAFGYGTAPPRELAWRAR